MVVTYIAAISNEDLEGVDLGGSYVTGEINSGKSFEVNHDGAYEFLGNAWSMGMMTMRAKKYKAKDWPFEQYWNSPFEVSPNDLKTSVYFPMK
jgi:effector-binding domain-containing protein